MHCSRRTYRVKYTAALDNQIDFNHVARKGLGDTPAASVHEAGIWEPDGTEFRTSMALQYTGYSHESSSLLYPSCSQVRS